MARSSTVFISGEQVPLSDIAAYVIADDIARSAALAEGVTERPPATDERFAPIRDLLFALEQVGGHARALAWLVTPNERLHNERPLEMLAAGRWDLVQTAIPTTQEQFPSAN